MRTFAGEPVAGPWRAITPEGLADELVRVGLESRVASSRTGALVVGIDGRSAGGKSTLAAVLASVVPGSAVVRTDDVAWWHSSFDWDELLVEGVLEPLSRGDAISYRPPSWVERGRDGAIRVPRDTGLLFVEGVGSTRVALAPRLDAALWVQSDSVEAHRRGLERDLALGREQEEAVRFWDEWEAHEITFLRDDRPWERADLVVLGTPDARTPGASDDDDDDGDDDDTAEPLGLWFSRGPADPAGPARRTS